MQFSQKKKILAVKDNVHIYIYFSKTNKEAYNLHLNSYNIVLNNFLSVLIFRVLCFILLNAVSCMKFLARRALKRQTSVKWFLKINIKYNQSITMTKNENKF